MATDSTPGKAPEHRELDQKLAKLALLQDQLSARELELATLRAELHAFEAKYNKIVGVKFVELDKLEAEIAERLAATMQTPDARERATRARAEFERSEKAYESLAQKPRIFQPTKSLKDLFRQVAKLVHPDLAVDEKDRSLRTEYMAQANQAYSSGDENRLKAILSEWLSHPDNVVGGGIGADLVRTIRKIAQVTERMRAVDIELSQLRDSDLFQLRKRADESLGQERDLLEEMAASISAQISAKRNQLAGLGKATSPQ